MSASESPNPWCVVRGCPRCRTTTVAFGAAPNTTRGYCDIHINHLLDMGVRIVGTTGHPSEDTEP